MRQSQKFGCARLALAAVVLCVGMPSALAQTAAEQYARVLAEADSLTRYNEQIQHNLKAQEAQLVAIQGQLTALDSTSADLLPLINRMYEQLRTFIATDLPFLDPSQASPDHRVDRMTKLRDLMADETTRPGEKYRRLLETVQIEIEYGRTMASYKGKLPDGREVHFVRLGRISLMYRTTDGEDSGYWDAEQKQWVSDKDYAEAIETAIQVAAKTKAPDLIAVPVPAPQEVRS
jgi:uncharacterized membrane-anchored protein YhcB (DUF1043 family)